MPCLLATHIGLQRIEEKLEKSSNTEQGIEGEEEQYRKGNSNIRLG
jgi:hypothetical protein